MDSVGLEEMACWNAYKFLQLPRLLKTITGLGVVYIWHMGSVFFRWALACLVLCAAPVWADDVVVHRAYFEDPSNQLTLQEVQAQSLTPYSGVLTRGFSASAFWIRLTIAPSPEKREALFEQHYLVRVLPHYLDEIALFDPAMGQVKPRYAGDRHASDSAGYTSLNHNFVIERSNQPRDIWLRLKTSSSNSISIKVLPIEEALVLDQKQDVGTGLIIAALVLFWMWSVIYWWRSREPIAVALVISQGLSVLYATTLWGYWRLWFGDLLTPEVIDTLSVLFIVFSGNAFLWFHIRFLTEFDPSRWGLRLLRVVLLAFPLELLFFGLGETRWGLQLNILMALFTTPALLVVALTAKVWESLKPGQAMPVFSKSYLIAFYVLLNLFLFLLALPTLPRRTEFGIASGPIFGFFSGLVVVVTLQLRARSIQKANADMQLSLQLSEQEVTHERQQREAQNHFMGMLTHELKTPLGVVLMAISSSAPSAAMRERARRAIQDMNNVIERCVLVDKLEEGSLSQVIEDFDAVQELQQVVQSFDSDRLQMRLDAAQLTLHTDRQLVGVVLKNLLENALKYSPKDSAEQVHVWRDTVSAPHTLHVRVTNLPGDAGWPDTERLFSKYYRSAGSHRSTGSGLGLHLSKQIAIYLGGDVLYAPDAQTVRFELCLPV